MNKRYSVRQIDAIDFLSTYMFTLAPVALQNCNPVQTITYLAAITSTKVLSYYMENTNNILNNNEGVKEPQRFLRLSSNSSKIKSDVVYYSSKEI